MVQFYQRMIFLFRTFAGGTAGKEIEAVSIRLLRSAGSIRISFGLVIIVFICFIKTVITAPAFFTAVQAAASGAGPLPFSGAKKENAGMQAGVPVALPASRAVRISA